MLAHDEVTGLATAGDVRLLGMIVHAEQHRIPAAEAEEQLAGDECLRLAVRRDAVLRRAAPRVAP